MISPTYPKSAPSAVFFLTFKSPPSFPLMPIALLPSFSTFWTRDLFILFKTISTISMVKPSVYLRPFINLGSTPNLPTQDDISLPPPWTMIGLNPTSFRSTTSFITLSLSSSSTIQLPPYLMIIIFLLKCCMYGKASRSVLALSITWLMFSSLIFLNFINNLLRARTARPYNGFHKN